jgi:ABC-type dipeptide/oligopeptide/nickel transport system ATPase subunit
VVVVVDVLPQASFKPLDVIEFVEIEELRLKRAKEAFHGGVVQTVALARHALG